MTKSGRVHIEAVGRAMRGCKEDCCKHIMHHRADPQKRAARRRRRLKKGVLGKIGVHII